MWRHRGTCEGEEDDDSHCGVRATEMSAAPSTKTLGGGVYQIELTRKVSNPTHTIQAHTGEGDRGAQPRLALRPQEHSQDIPSRRRKRRHGGGHSGGWAAGRSGTHGGNLGVAIPPLSDAGGELHNVVLWGGGNCISPNARNTVVDCGQRSGAVGFRRARRTERRRATTDADG